MKEICLVRLTQDPHSPQRGVLMCEGEPRYLTLELPWLDNEPNESCIPTGEYHCKRVHKRKLASGAGIENTFEVENVPNRAGILFHAGNTIEDTRGCILLGLRYGGLRTVKTRFSPTLEKFYYDGEDVSYVNQKAVLSSKEAFDLFLGLLALDNEFNLKVSKVTL